MELERKYDICLDHVGYMIEPKSYRRAPAPLLGTKFATGRSSYSELDFWQIGGMTDFTKGINQKYLVDPSMCQYSEGLDLSKPGELKLERDIETVSATLLGNVSARFRTTSALWLGTVGGHIYYTTDGITFTKDYSTGEAKIFGFFEIEGRLYASTGPGNIWVRRGALSWEARARTSISDGKLNYSETFTPTETIRVNGTIQYAQTFKVTTSNSTFNKLAITLGEVGTPGTLFARIYKDNGNKPDMDNGLLANFSFAQGSAGAGPIEVVSTLSGITLNYGLMYWLIFVNETGNSSNYWKVFKSSGQRATLTNGTLYKKVFEESGLSNTSYSRYIWDVNCAAQPMMVDNTTKYNKITLPLTKIAAPEGDLDITIETDDSNKPSGVPVASFTIMAGDVSTSYKEVEKTFTPGFDLTANTKYWIVAKATGVAAGSTGRYVWCEHNPSVSTKGNSKTSADSGTTWSASTANSLGFKVSAVQEWDEQENEDVLFYIERTSDTGLYFTMVESDYAFGWFSDGIRRSTDGYSWVPEPPDPLWVLPSSEGVPLNATSIPRGFIAGSYRGLWTFIGGSSGINIQNYPDYGSTDNFRGMDRWGHYGIFSIEKQGLFFTDGAQTFPTNLTFSGEGFKSMYCTTVYASGWDIYATVSPDNVNWYLARCNMLYQKMPQYWWIVKKLDSKAVYMAGLDDNNILLFFSDNTIKKLDKESGPYVTSGYMHTSWIDENMVRLQKQYNSISMILSSFPASTSATLGYRLTDTAFNEQTYTTTGVTENVMSMPNPTVGNRIQLKAGLSTSSTSVTPILTDLTWKYILETPSEETTMKMSFSFQIIGEDILEDRLGAKSTRDPAKPYRLREDIISDIWTTAGKKQVLNFIGADNKTEYAMDIKYDGSGASCLMTIDRTNFLLTTAVDGVAHLSYSYKNKTMAEVIEDLNDETDYYCVLNADVSGTRSAHDMEPRLSQEIKGNNFAVTVGSDVHSVMINPGSPTQSKLVLDGRGSDRIMITLRET